MKEEIFWDDRFDSAIAEMLESQNHDFDIQYFFVKSLPCASNLSWQCHAFLAISAIYFEV